MENKKEQVIRETKLLVKLFLEYNESDIDLAKRTGLSSSTVGRRLTNRDIILLCFPSNGERLFEIIKEKRKYNLNRGKAIGSQTSIINYLNNTPKLRLDIIYKDEDKQMQFLSHLVLHFRCKPALISELFGFDEDDITTKLLDFNKGCYESFNYLFYKDNYDQEQAKINVIDYYRNLIEAISKKDIATKNVLIREISDNKVIEFKNNHTNGDIKDDNDILTLLRYQLKYAVSNRKMGEKFHFDDANYARRVRKLIENNQELQNRYELLVNYNLESAVSQWKV